MSGQYEFRAPPRRRVKDESDAPLFLKKLFSMINECPAHLGGWSANGEFFIVKVRAPPSASA